MKFGRLSPSQVLPLAGMITPLAAVLVVRIMFGGGPAEAPAAMLESASALPADLATETQATPLTDEQQAAIDFLRIEVTPRPLRSPLARPAAPMVVDEPIVPEQFEPKPDDPSEHLVLTSIVGKGDRALASLSGKVYRIGDEVGPSWHLSEINTAERQITITSESGETRVMKIKTDEHR
ncbi:hypothetical protein MNBD_PLANCTO03-567 [hydrothermal vent metagenome]|uniref:Uncharacterized protein n=1 Tax=hydrothermal vent metagenome TaxID=652676 RepID=A0A3B1E7B1_9ZZZZ